MRFVAHDYWGDNGRVWPPPEGESEQHEIAVRGSADAVLAAVGRLLKKLELMGDGALKGMGKHPFLRIEINLMRDGKKPAAEVIEVLSEAEFAELKGEPLGREIPF